jgi:hypothetical protein
MGFGVASMFDDWPQKGPAEALALFTSRALTALCGHLPAHAGVQHRTRRAGAAIPKMLALGAFIKAPTRTSAPKPRTPGASAATSAGPPDEPWLDFVMLQAGHRMFMKGPTTWAKYRHEPHKPLLESEANYEGFAATNFVVDAGAVRRSAYTAIHSGRLRLLVRRPRALRRRAEPLLPPARPPRGAVLTWEEGLHLPGGAQMQHLRACYEAVPWWKLGAAAGGAEARRRRAGEGRRREAPRALLHFQRQGPRFCPRLTACPQTRSTAANGSIRAAASANRSPIPITATTDGLPLPKRPDAQDWLLLLRRAL